MFPLYIFDLDGTLALTDHRQHLLADTDNPKRWDDFFAACVDDVPNQPVIKTLHVLSYNADVFVWSGRSDAVRADTEAWLAACGLHLVIKMRADGDYTPDDELKKSWYVALPDRDKDRLVAIFDDRDKVVNMWREMGLACFQVARGAF